MLNIFAHVQGDSPCLDMETRNYIMAYPDDALKQISDKLMSLTETLNSDDLYCSPHKNVQ